MPRQLKIHTKNTIWHEAIVIVPDSYTDEEAVQAILDESVSSEETGYLYGTVTDMKPEDNKWHSTLEIIDDGNNIIYKNAEL